MKYGNPMHSVLDGYAKFPEIGMGATLLSWTDRHPATITKIWKKGVYIYVEVQEDKAIRTDKNGMSESQEYRYEPDKTAGKSVYRSKHNRKYVGTRLNEKTQRWVDYESGGLLIGEREKYHDYSF